MLWIIGIVMIGLCVACILEKIERIENAVNQQQRPYENPYD